MAGACSHWATRLMSTFVWHPIVMALTFSILIKAADIFEFTSCEVGKDLVPCSQIFNIALVSKLIGVFWKISLIANST